MGGKGESVTLPYSLNGASPANSRMLLEVSRIPSVDISRRFDYLYNYQHHCTEQLTSKALPLLFVSQFKAVDEEEAQKIKANVQEAIRQLYARQLPNGGLFTGRGMPVLMSGLLLMRACSLYWHRRKATLSTRMY